MRAMSERASSAAGDVQFWNLSEAWKAVNKASILETNEEDEEEDVDIFETFDEFPTGDLPTFAKGGPGGLGGLREPGEDHPPEPSTKQRDERHRT